MHQTKTRNMITGANVLPTKILVKALEKKEKSTQSGIIIPSNIIKDVNITADVILCGKGTPQIEMSVKAGERVLFNPHAFQRVILDDTEYGLIDVRDVLFFFKPESVA